jgi:hypothetical protein
MEFLLFLLNIQYLVAEFCPVLVLIQNLVNRLLWQLAPFLLVVFFVVSLLLKVSPFSDPLYQFKELLKFFLKAILLIYFGYFIVYLTLYFLGVAQWVGSFTKQLFYIPCP